MFQGPVIVKYERQFLFQGDIHPTPELVSYADKWKKEKPVLKMSFLTRKIKNLPAGV